MEKLKLNIKKCKGCFLCANVCPRGALYDSGKINEKGYKIIALDESKCVKCGSCFKICPDFVFSIVDE